MQKVQKDWIDRALTHINPRLAYERIAWKSGIRTYDGGSTDRTNSGWTAVNAPAEQMNQGSRDRLRARSRDMERNADMAEAIIGAFERNVVGTGLRLQAKPLNAEDEEDAKLGRQMEELFDEWCRAENCDITGETDFNEMQSMALRRMIVDGGYLFVLTDNPYNGKFSFMLQMREVDDIDGNKFAYSTASGQNRIINGVELNQYNKPVAYWLKNTTPDGLTLGDSVRVPAERVIFLNKKIRPTQVREIPKLANTIDRIRDLNEFTEAISIKERVLACLAVFIKKMLPGNGGPGRGNQFGKTDKTSGYETKMLAPGMISELQPGDDISTVNPSGQASNARDFISSEQRLAAAGQGLSYETVSRDMSQVNYSSARQGLIEDDKTYDIIREYIKRRLCIRTYRMFIIQCVLEGKLKIEDFFSNMERYLRHSWIAPGRNWIDPLKEVNANEKALNSNQTTLAQICTASGLDWREVIKQRAEEIKYAQSLGITEGDNNGKKNQK